MLLTIMQAIYFMLPAYVANMAPTFFKEFLKSLAIPVDFGRKFRGKPLFGEHKTIRGLIVAAVFGTIVFFIQKLLYNVDFFRNISLIDYSNTTIFMGFLLGSGAILGDLIKSFFKRRVGIRPGGSFFPFDQSDFVIGALLFGAIIYFPPWRVVLTIFLVSILGHLLFSNIGYYLKLKKDRW